MSVAASTSSLDEVFASAIEKFGMSYREGQIQMAKIVADTLKLEDCCNAQLRGLVAETKKKVHICAVEAGTGVGKSLGYLLPIYALSREGLGKVVVSTGTKNLQQRLFEKDAPLAARITGVDLTVAIMKGRNNYLCVEALLNELRKEQKKRAGQGFKSRSSRETFYETLSGLLQKGEWSGELEDMPLIPGFSKEEIFTWFSDVSAASDHADCRNCSNQACSFLQARTRASTANIIVANHHLVAADFALRQEADFSLFSKKAPPTILILDEAHEFPDAFRSVFEARFTFNRWVRLRGDFLRFIEGLIEAKQPSNGEPEEAAPAFDENLDAIASLDEKAKQADSALRELFASFDKKLDSAKKKSVDSNAVPLFPDEQTERDKELAEAAFIAMMQYCRAAEGIAEKLLDSFVDADRKMLKMFYSLCARCRKIQKDFERTVMLKNHYRTVGTFGDACSYDGRAFLAQPVKIADKLRQLWNVYGGGVVLTSATLFPRPKSSGYEWFRDEFGLPEDALLKIVPSPFRYEEQMDVLVFSNEELLPTSPKRAQALVEVILRAAEKNPDGGILVLFTSFNEMHKVAKLLAPLVPDGRVLLVQGQNGSRTKILQKFKEHGRGILFGVDSFWQGVDVPGKALSTVIIAKLPFPVPEDPLVEAKVWLAGKENGWQKVCKPLCALKLQQGVGRLIRTETDRGMVLLCDPRALNKHKQFLKAFPTIPKKAILQERSEPNVASC